MNLSEEDIDTITAKFAIAIAKTLQQARSVSDSEHYDHHVWITARIKEAEARRMFWEDMQKHVYKWGAISVMTFLFYGFWLAIKDALLRG